MESIQRRKLCTVALILMASLATGVAPAAAQVNVDVYLRAVRTTKGVPGGSVPVWAFESCTSSTFGTCAPATVPGPVITANAGDNLRITVRNMLGPGFPLSLVVPGQPEGGSPVMSGGRVRSFVDETPAGGTLANRTKQYVWSAVKPGTFLYQSGTHPSIQVPMGLYGAVVVNAPATYPGAVYTAQRLLLFSEIDPVQNTLANSAATASAYPSTIDYNPKYFLVNGVPFDAAAPLASTFDVLAPGSVLLRLANAGLRSHIATIAGVDLDVRAEDGNVYPSPRNLSAVLLPAGKTHDALATLANDRTYAVYDRMLDLTNLDAPDGGMLAYLKVGAGSPPPPVGAVAGNDNYMGVEDSPLELAAPGVLSNDGGLANATLVVRPTHGSVSLGSDGSFTYTPNPDFAGQDAFLYAVSNGGSSSTATVQINVQAANDPPVARDDSFTNTFGSTLSATTPGVLANDGDPEGDTLSAVLAGSEDGCESTLTDAITPIAWSATAGTFSYTSVGTWQFQYCAKDPSGALSAPVTVTLDLKPVRSLQVNVVGVPTGPVGPYRWLVEEDATWHPDPANPAAPSLGTNFHRSHMPVVAQGCEPVEAGCGDVSQLALDPAKHYYLSVLPRSAGSGEGHTNGGAPIAAALGGRPAQQSVTVYVNRQPLPAAQMSIFVFEDNAPTNGAPDGNEPGLGGFEIVLEDAGGRYGQNGGRMLTDKDGQLLTNAKAGTPGCPLSAGSRPGVILTCPDGTALIQNLAPAKYGVSVVPPQGSTDGWVQTSTIEGTKVNDAWIKANEPAYFQEFGPPGYHVFTGFVSPKRLVKRPPGSIGANTVSGRVTNMHMSRPPVQTLYDAGSNDAMAHTTAWVGLNGDNGVGANLVAVKAGSDGSFSIPDVPNGTYQLVVWDDYLDQIISYRTLRLPGGGDLGNVPVFQWFARLEHNVFLDMNQNGFRDDEASEPGLIEQNVNIRFRDGSIYQSYPTDHTGFVPFDQFFPFFNWMVAEVDYARLKPTGVTVTVDAGGALPSDNPVLTPQQQNTGECSPAGCDSRTETGPQLLQAVQGFLGQTSVLDWGKAPYAPGENGGISGIVYYASTRAENNPRLAAADTWEPGIPSAKVRLYREVPANGGGTRLALVDEVETDSWDKSPPEGCPGAFAGDSRYPSDEQMLGAGNLSKCYDGMRNWNQVRPGVFDGGYAFSDIPPGKYVVEVIPPPGYELVKEEDKNVDFGDAYGLAPAALMLPNLAVPLAPDQALVADALAAQEPQPGILQPPCVGAGHDVPQYLTLFEDQLIEAPYATANRPLCDRKEVVLSDQTQAAADFFLFTSTPVAGHFTGMILDDLSQEFDAASPSFGEKWAPPFTPVSIRDWTGRELSRIRSDKWGRINGLVPSTFTANVPSPSGYAPNMVTTCMNDPGPIPDPSDAARTINDPHYDPRYGTFCYTFQYMPGTTTYLDTPVLPTSAFAAGEPPVDCAFPNATPVIRQVNGNASLGPFVNPDAGLQLTILSQGPTEVPNPDYEGPGAASCPAAKPTCQQKTIVRDHGFGSFGGAPNTTGSAATGQAFLGNVPLVITSWSNTEIRAQIPASGGNPLVPVTSQLRVRRSPASGGRSTITAVTVTVSRAASDQPLRVAAGQSISDRIASATPGALVLVEPGTYDELVVMARPVRLQGSGAGSTIINATKRPAEKLDAWRIRVDGLVSGGEVEPLPGQAFAGGGLEPTTLGTEEGAGITVLAPAGGAYRFRTRAPRIDGFSVTGGDTGGGIFVNGWAHDLEVSNNRVFGNQGYYHGGIRVGRPFLEGLEDQVAAYAFNENVRIHNNAITQNGGLAGAGGGVSLCTGTDDYQLFDNWVCGNFSEGNGGGVAHFGRSHGGQILRNQIHFNQSYNQGLTVSGGGLYLAGEPPAGTGLSLGAGRNLVVEANLVQGNHAGAGHGGGVRLERINGADRARTPACNLGGLAAAQNACFQVRLTNNIIVNNVAGWSGGGVSLLDAARVQIVNNTVARNDSTATVGGLFAGSPNASQPQPAGVASEPHSPALAGAMPNGHNNKNFSNPTLLNNILWQNRAMVYNQVTGSAGLYADTGGVPFTSTSCPLGTNISTWTAWDLGVLDPAYQLNPTFTVLTGLMQHGKNYNGNSNTTGNPNFAGAYCNGARSHRLFAEVTTGPVDANVIQVAPALDEGGNWIDVRYGPISLTGDYHLAPAPAASSAVNTGTPATILQLPGALLLGVPLADFDGQQRVTIPFTAFDRGADERRP